MNDILPWYLNMYCSTPVPWWVIGGIVVVAIGALVWKWQYRWMIMLAAYCTFIVCHTLVFRGSSAEAKYILEPFWRSAASSEYKQWKRTLSQSEATERTTRCSVGMSWRTLGRL